MKFSIIMPVYNSEKTVIRSIISIQKQSYENWELIAIDDGSTDNSLSVLEDFRKIDNRIKVFHQNNMGPGNARNYGICMCSGDYICFIDSDDYYEDNYLEMIKSKIERTNADLIYIGMINELENKKTIRKISTIRYRKCNKDELLQLQLSGILPWGPCSKVIRRKIAENCKFQDIDVGEELLYSFDILKNSIIIEFVDEFLYHYVHNANGQHKKGGLNPWGDLVKSVKSYLQNNNLIDIYEKSLNTLATKALTISIYRCCTLNKYKKALLEMKKIIKLYKEQYNIDDNNKKILDIKTQLVMFFINKKMYYTLFLISNIRNKRKD